MTTHASMAHIDELEKLTHSCGDSFKASVGGLTALLGMKKLGCSVVELEAGKRAWPFHLHYGQEELFVILSGEGTLRYGETETPIRQGHVIFTPTGEGTAHQIINTSNGLLRYLALSSLDDPEICYYPDSDKYGSYAGDANTPHALEFMAEKSSAIDYWKDE